jgi:hypothetical protein
VALLARGALPAALVAATTPEDAIEAVSVEERWVSNDRP